MGEWQAERRGPLEQVPSHGQALIGCRPGWAVNFKMGSGVPGQDLGGGRCRCESLLAVPTRQETGGMTIALQRRRRTKKSELEVEIGKS